MADVAIRKSTADDLSEQERSAIITLCTAAFNEPFDALFTLLPGSQHILVTVDEVLTGHACWVTRWLQPAGLPPLATAYVEAVATAPAAQGCGYGSLAMRQLTTQIQTYPLCALSPAVPPFYARLGWELWCGPTAIRTANGVLPTPDEQIMILRTPWTPTLDHTALITAEWRTGELW